ncbi:MAG: hypothetical protein L0Z50_37905 [Verrucomicrobiales bacterium]|nr:hypothetical protein [Verrucomicrobiales bacterium]
MRISFFSTLTLGLLTVWLLPQPPANGQENKEEVDTHPRVLKVMIPSHNHFQIPRLDVYDRVRNSEHRC